VIVWASGRFACRARTARFYRLERNEIRIEYVHVIEVNKHEY
jgi:hypothetical protein